MSAVLGRQDELDQIARFLDAVEGGDSRLLLLSGQAGIGKTTLWEAAIGSAEERGFGSFRRVPRRSRPVWRSRRSAT